MKYGVINCICDKRDNRVCVGHQICPKKRDDDMGFIGQNIWLLLQKHRFVGRDDGLHYHLTPRERKLKNWLIYGKWQDVMY